MTALRNTSIFISILSIAVLTVFWLAGFKERNGITMENSIVVLCLDIFYILLLWVPHRYRESTRLKTLTRVTFLLSILPILLVLILMTRIEC